MTEYERVQGEISGIILNWRLSLKDKIAQILSFVEIKSDDQSLPKGLTARLNLPHLEHYLYGQEALEEAGFIKVAPKEE